MVTAATREQLHRVVDKSGTLVLVTMTHPSIDDVHVVNDTRDWTIGAITYIGLPFRFQLPAAVAGQAPRAQIEVDNVGLALTAELEKLPPGAALQATVTVVSRNTPTNVELQITAPLSNVGVTTAAITATLGNDDALRAPAVKLRYDPTNSPGLFDG